MVVVPHLPSSSSSPISSSSPDLKKSTMESHRVSSATDLLSANDEQTTDILIEIPELDGIRIVPGLEIRLFDLESDAPRLELGPLIFTGQYQQILGTTLLVNDISDITTTKPIHSLFPPSSSTLAGGGSSGSRTSKRGKKGKEDETDEDEGGIKVEALVQKKIVFQLRQGSIDEITMKKKK